MHWRCNILSQCCSTDNILYTVQHVFVCTGISIACMLTQTVLLLTIEPHDRYTQIQADGKWFTNFQSRHVHSKHAYASNVQQRKGFIQHSTVSVGCRRSTICIVMSPVGPYFPTGLKPVSLFLDESNVRAWPGGVGNNKVGTNYAPTIGPQSDAADQYGTSQVLYSFPQGSRPDDALVSECGSMNLMFLLQKVTKHAASWLRTSHNHLRDAYAVYACT